MTGSALRTRDLRGSRLPSCWETELFNEPELWQPGSGNPTWGPRWSALKGVVKDGTCSTVSGAGGAELVWCGCQKENLFGFSISRLKPPLRTFFFLFFRGHGELFCHAQRNRRRLKWIVSGWDTYTCVCLKEEEKKACVVPPHCETTTPWIFLSSISKPQPHFPYRRPLVVCCLLQTNPTTDGVIFTQQRVRRPGPTQQGNTTQPISGRFVHFYIVVNSDEVTFWKLCNDTKANYPLFYKKVPHTLTCGHEKCAWGQWQHEACKQQHSLSGGLCPTVRSRWNPICCFLRLQANTTTLTVTPALLIQWPLHARQTLQ